MMKNTRHIRFICLGASLAALFVIYIPALRNYPVADSWVFLVPHTFGETLSYFRQSMIPLEWDTLWLRPVAMLLFWLDSVIWPGTAWGPHLLNIILHLVNAALVWTLAGLLITGGKRGHAGLTGRCAACLIYGLHPLAVGAVAWIAARFDVLSLTFGLAGAILWLKLDARGGWRVLAGMMAMLILGLLSKEQGVVFMMAVFAASALRLVQRRNTSMHRAVLAMLAITVIAYTIYRFAVFGGIGGYLSARHGFSILPPIYYAAAILFPFLNLFPGWSLHWTMFMGVAFAMFAALQLRKRDDAGSGTDWVRLLVPTLVVLFGLATTMPNPGLTFIRIMHHIESRFVLMAIAGIAVLAGVALERASRTRYRGVVIAGLIAWCAVAAWRTDIQLQAWHGAGEAAQRIVMTTKQLAPDPEPGRALIFLDIPRENGQYAYIFGIGLEEALRLAYGRDDFRIVRFPTRDDLNSADPGRDFVFHWDERRGDLERLHTERRETP